MTYALMLKQEKVFNYNYLRLTGLLGGVVRCCGGACIKRFMTASNGTASSAYSDRSTGFAGAFLWALVAGFAMGGSVRRG